MPYAVKMMGKKHIVYNKETGKAHHPIHSNQRRVDEIRETG